jgi:hypothetical protein
VAQGVGVQTPSMQKKSKTTKFVGESNYILLLPLNWAMDV